MTGADFIAGRPGPMTGYRAGDIRPGDRDVALRTRMEEGNLLGQAHDQVAQALNTFVGNANDGLARYTSTARSSGHDYLDSDETGKLHIGGIGNSPVGG